MSQNQEKFVSGKAQVICFILTVLFFFFMWNILPSHVPAQTTAMINLFSGLGAALIAAVFWIATMCFTVVYVDTKRRNQSKVN